MIYSEDKQFFSAPFYSESTPGPRDTDSFDVFIHNSSTIHRRLRLYRLSCAHNPSPAARELTTTPVRSKASTLAQASWRIYIFLLAGV
jgi:hypothetical protein